MRWRIHKRGPPAAKGHGALRQRGIGGFSRKPVASSMLSGAACSSGFGRWLRTIGSSSASVLVVELGVFRENTPGLWLC